MVALMVDLGPHHLPATMPSPWPLSSAPATPGAAAVYMSNQPVAPVRQALAATNNVANIVPPQAFEVASPKSTRWAMASPWASRPALTAAPSKLAHAAHIGNVYINRNQIGAVMGVQLMA